MIYLSICTRDRKKISNTLQSLIDYSRDAFDGYPTVRMDTLIEDNASSIYAGHSSNLNKIEQPEEDDIVVFMHDDVEILSSPSKFKQFIEFAKKPGVGFVGIAGATNFPANGGWWTSRQSGETRGFVWQGKDDVSMKPNYFGQPGQVTVLDGCLFASTYKTIKEIGMVQPEYLTSNWDFYDIHLTFLAHYKGYSNYVVPIMIRHESDGHMRDGWYQAKDEFMKRWNREIPCAVPVDKTNGLPK